MYNGVKAMIAKEKELGGGGQATAAAAAGQEPEEVKCGPHLKDPEQLTGYPVFPEGTKSLLAKNLSRDLWNQLKDTKDKHGVSFKQAILSGC